ncbi:MAG: acetyl xylan esterase [Verrucomicrobiales bacterium]|nr:acetyl xylan esterase [Verrucomicrobiales bacterium]
MKFRSRFLLLWLSLGLPLSGLAQDTKPVHFFLLSGQSNMAGLNPENGFLPEAKKLLPDAEIVHLKVARGGQPIRLWLKEWDEIAGKHGLDVKNEGKTPYYDQILAQFAELKKKYPDGFDSVSFCWMQGERDAKSGLDGAYEDALKKLIANLRRDLDAPEMNFVIGRLSDHDPKGQWTKGWAKVRDVQVKIAKEDENGAWVDTDDLNDIEKKGVMTNDLHYSKEGYATFGQRLAQQAVRLIKGEEPKEDGR